jgi:hypothetical protein
MVVKVTAVKMIANYKHEYNYFFKFILSVARFQSGREIKKKATLFGLRVRTSPQPPVIQLPANGQITDKVMNNLKMKGRKVKTFVPVERLVSVFLPSLNC